MSDNRSHDHLETMHRISQANRAAGGITMLPEEWNATVESADELNRNMFIELPYDNDPVAQRIAGRVLKEYSDAWDVAKGRQVETYWCSEADAGVFVLNHCHQDRAVALRDIAQLDTIAEYMDGSWRCDVKVNKACGRVCGGVNAEYPVEFLAVKRGDYICAFTACLNCLEHIKTGAGLNDDYIGPPEDWHDDRNPPKPDPDDPFDL